MTLTYNSGVVEVVYQAEADYYMTEVHLYIGNEPLLRDKKGNFTVAPGPPSGAAQIPLVSIQRGFAEQNNLDIHQKRN